MRLHYVPLLAGISIGCATTTAAVPPVTPAAETSELGALRQRSEAQARRITELEARLGLLEAEAREMRVLVQERPTTRPDVIRIGAHRAAPSLDLPTETETASEPVDAPMPVATRERRPLLRSVGEPQMQARDMQARGPIVLPIAPAGVPDRLPVVPLPTAGSTSPVVTAPIAASATSSPERIRDEYRAALTLVRNRDFDAAVSALTEFLSKYPDQEFTDRAMFWRAEAFYAKRDYERALAEFEALGARFPRSEKAADALLKIGLCHQRLGDEQRAQVMFQRLRDQFPESDAARAASKEGA